MGNLNIHLCIGVIYVLNSSTDGTIISSEIWEELIKAHELNMLD